MNILQRKMLDILVELKEKYGAISVKADFEAEGTKTEDLLRLKEISMTAGLNLALKIGGCESIRDMLEARIIGVNLIVAPMIESAYSLKKYLEAIQKVFPQDERENIEVFCNIETVSAMDNFDEILNIPEIAYLNGIVIERVDLCNSLGMGSDEIENNKICQYVLDIIQKAKEKDLVCTVGGGVSANSLKFIQSLSHDLLHRYETRKICFSTGKTNANSPEKGILKALAFEVFWLKDKINFYKIISKEDEARMNIIESRYWKEIETAF